jgi:Uma2 family endonuclease
MAMTQLESPVLHRPPKRWTKQEYNAAADRGAFAVMKVFLYRGELIEKPPQQVMHVQGVKRLNYWLIETFRPEFEVRLRGPFELVDESEPEPDGGVFTKEQDARRPHPNAAELLIEVSDSSIELDREMAFDYAAAGVPDYWIVNVRDREIEVYRQPIADRDSVTGFRDADRKVFGVGQAVAPLVRPEISVSIAAFVDVG